MKLSEMPIGSALLCKKRLGVVDTFFDDIEEGDYFVEVRIDKEDYIEYPLAEQFATTRLRDEIEGVHIGREQVMREFLEELEQTVGDGNFYDDRGISIGFSAALFLAGVRKKYEEELKR